MADTRREHDLLGERDLPADALYGIHTARAVTNFPLAGRPVRPAMIHAYGQVKLACAQANHELGRWDDPTFAAIRAACEQLAAGELDEHIRVDALQGGAGTSTNMNVNEVLANRALELIGRRPGDYDTLSPTDDINLHQSTNDTFPTALRVGAIFEIQRLEQAVTGLQEAFQAKEKQLADVVKVARTEYQDAVLITLGREMGAYAEAFTRDRWRIYKCVERLRVVNLGGTAVGTGLGAPRKYIFRAIEHLRSITGLGLARAENLVEATQNTDALVEVHGILKALASNLLKITTDLRLLSSGPEAGLGELRLPPRQAGSSIMPGKVNPVICEAAGQAAIAVLANDQALTLACSMGSLELNAFYPLIAEALLGSLDLLTGACEMLRTRCVEGITAHADRCRAHVDVASALATALASRLGYDRVSELAAEAHDTGRPLRELVIDKGLLTRDELDAITTPEAVNRLGSPRPEDHA